jgi:hypothetical protein
MRILNVRLEDYLSWAEETEIEYAAKTTAGKRLKFIVTPSGSFTVKYGNNILYNGHAVQKAIRAFNYVEKVE